MQLTTHRGSERNLEENVKSCCTLSMFGSGLLVVVWACDVLAFAAATGSSVEPLGAPDECARCFAENERLTGRIEQLVVRVGQLEAELAAQRGDWQGGAFFHARKI
jgi:hypothetical protein